MVPTGPHEKGGGVILGESGGDHFPTPPLFVKKTKTNINYNINPGS